MFGGVIKLAADVDGIIYPFVDAFREWLGDPNLPEPTTFAFASEWGIADTDFPRLVTEFGEEGGYSKLAPYADVVDALSRCDAMGIDVLAVTSRPATRVVLRSTMAWFAEHEIPVRGLELCCDKTMIDAHVLIDDDPSVYAAVESTDECVPILLARSWNGGGVERRGDWESILAALGLAIEAMSETPDMDDAERRWLLGDIFDESLLAQE